MNNQRWRDQRDSYRPAGETIRTSAYEVATIASDKVARAFVIQHHYSASYPAARFRFGLYTRGELVGVAVFSQPANNLVITKTFAGFSHTDGVELGRFVLLDEVPGNGETWFLGQCFRELKRLGLGGIVSYSDPSTRTNAAGAQVFAGHVGTIYQAHNGIYLGRGRRRTLRILPDGTVFSDRSASKIRARVRGWRYSVEQLVAQGARPPFEDEDLARWLVEARESTTRKTRHPGHHKYAWGLTRTVRRALPLSVSYPKKDR